MYKVLIVSACIIVAHWFVSTAIWAITKLTAHKPSKECGFVQCWRCKEKFKPCCEKHRCINIGVRY